MSSSPPSAKTPKATGSLEAEWMAQLPPRTLLERHYVEKIAAASWRLRRLHRWQAQLFEDDTLTEGERLDRLDKVLRHETALHRQIDTAVKMLNKDAPQLYRPRVRDQVLEDTQISERECREDADDERAVAMEIRNRLYRIRKATKQAGAALAQAPLDTTPNAEADESPGERAGEPCENEICENKPPALGTLPPISTWSQRHWRGIPAPDALSVPTALSYSPPFPGATASDNREALAQSAGVRSQVR